MPPYAMWLRGAADIGRFMPRPRGRLPGLAAHPKGGQRMRGIRALQTRRGERVHAVGAPGAGDLRGSHRRHPLLPGRRAPLPVLRPARTPPGVAGQVEQLRKRRRHLLQAYPPPVWRATSCSRANALTTGRPGVLAGEQQHPLGAIRPDNTTRAQGTTSAIPDRTSRRPLTHRADAPAGAGAPLEARRTAAARVTSRQPFDIKIHNGGRGCAARPAPPLRQASRCTHRRGPRGGRHMYPSFMPLARTDSAASVSTG